MVSFLSGVCPRLSVSASLSVFPYPSSHYANLSLSLTISTGMRVPSLGSLSLSLSLSVSLFKTSISFSGVYLWNNLPLTVRSCQSLSSFKRKLSAHLEVVT